MLFSSAPFALSTLLPTFTWPCSLLFSQEFAVCLAQNSKCHLLFKMEQHLVSMTVTPAPMAPPFLKEESFSFMKGEYQRLNKNSGSYLWFGFLTL